MTWRLANVGTTGFSGRDAAGYWNPLAKLFGLRCRSAKCFCLCGIFDRNDRDSFAIGLGTTVDVPPAPVSGTGNSELAFFANDTNGFYGNNCGELYITVRRIR